jgi:hypothetical protein
MGFSPNRSTAGPARDATIRQDFDQKDFDWEGFDQATPSNALIKQRFDQAKDTLRITGQFRRPRTSKERPTILASDPTSGRTGLVRQPPFIADEFTHPAALILPSIAWMVRRHARQERLI